jgi:cytosine permease
LIRPWDGAFLALLDEDAPMRELSAILRDYERQPVPAPVRKPWWTMALVNVAIAVNVGALLFGGHLAANLTFAESIGAIVFGSLLVAVIAAGCAVIGARTQLSTAMISRSVFGELGARIVSLLLASTLFGWFGVQAGFFGSSAAALIQNVWERDVDTWLLSLMGGVLMTSTAVLGYRAIEKLSLIAVPLLLGLLAVSVGSVLREQSLGQLLAAEPSAGPMTMGFATSLVAGTFIVGAVVAPDVTRWARSPRDAMLSVFVGFFAGSVVMLSMAVVLATATGTGDAVQVFLRLGMGTSALLILILAQWTTNDSNLYSSALGFSVVFPSVPKWQLSIVAGLIGTALAVLGIYGRLIPFLSVLTALIVPLSGILVAEYFLLKRGRGPATGETGPIMVWRSFPPWSLAALVAFATTPPAGGGPGWLTLTGLPGLDGFFVAVGLQYALGRVTRGAAEEAVDASGLKAPAPCSVRTGPPGSNRGGSA